MASNFIMLPLTVPTVACNLSARSNSSKMKMNEQCPSYEQSLHSKYHHKTITFFQLIWRYTTIKDKFLYTLGLVSALMTGAVIPVININFGQMIDIYIQHDEYKHLWFDVPDSRAVNSSLVSNDMNSEDFLPYNDTEIPRKLQKFRNNSYNLSFTILAIGFVYFFLCYMFAVLLELVSTRIIHRLRSKLYQILFTYDDLLSDSATSIDFASRMEDTICYFEKWIGTPIGLLFYMVSSAILSLVSAVYHGWELTFILISMLPILIVLRMFLGKKFARLHEISSEITYKTGTFIHCIIDQIRTILSYNGQSNERLKFNNLLSRELMVSRQKIFLESLITACLWLMSYMTFAVGIWYAAKFIIVSRDTSSPDDDAQYTVGSMIIIFWNVLSITYFVIRIRSYMYQFHNVPFHASTFINFIERLSHQHEKGLRPASFVPSVKFNNVSYTFQLNSGCSGCSNESSVYLFSECDEKTLASSVLSPLNSRSSQIRFTLPDDSYDTEKRRGNKTSEASISSLSESLCNVSFTVNEGETITILGEEGSGTSVIGKLLYQFFTLNPESNGEILLGENCMSSLNREWVKSVIGYVGGESIIYDATIRENVWIADKSCTSDDIVKACELANIGKFIESLPQSYDTNVGRKGIYLRPSEVIRLSIARALVKRAKILIIDRIFDQIDDPEQLEQVVYAVERSRIKLTTLIITSKITKCVKNSDLIVLLDEGKIIARGSHDDLMQEKGTYKQIYIDAMLQRENIFHSMNEPTKYSVDEDALPSPVSSKSFESAVADDVCRQTVIRDVIVKDVINRSSEINGDNFVAADGENLQLNGRKEVKIVVSDEDENIRSVVETPVDGDCLSKMRSSSVLSAASTADSDSTSDGGESEFYRGQRSKSIIKAKYAEEYTILHFIQYFDINDWILLSLGCLSSAVFGIGLPMYALIAGQFMSILEYKTADSILQEAKFISLQFICLSVIISLSSFTSHFTFGWFQASFTCKLKRKLFARILSLNLNWCENESPIHPPLIKSLFTEEIKTIPILMTSLLSSYSTLTGTLIICLGYSFYTHWKLAFIAATLMPLIIFRYSWMGRSSELQMKTHSHDRKLSVYRIIQTVRNKYKLYTSKSEQEAISKLDITQLLVKINEKYQAIIDNQSLTQQSDVHVRSQVVAAIQCIPILAYGLVYLFATYFIQSNSIHYTELFKIVEAVIFGSILVSEGSFFTYEMQSIRNIASLTSHLLNTFSTYKSSHVLSSDHTNEDNIISPFVQSNGLSVKLQSVSFRLHHYPYTSVLHNFTCNFAENSYTAVYSVSNDKTGPPVGPVILSLIQKLIDPTSGSILIDDRNIETISNEHIRRKVSLVSGSPLFLSTCTISENIALGDVSRFVSMDEIVAITRQLDIHNRIQLLPHGYNSKLQHINNELSPLDKLLLMLARTIVQDAAVILLENIDHALSQRIYMTHIDPVIQRFRSLGKTIITLPKNVTMNARVYDSIILLDENGSVVESGSHEHLIKLNGVYSRLHHLHSKD